MPRAQRVAPSNGEIYCSRFNPAEALPGTARRGHLTLCLEMPDHWGRSVLDGTAFSPELSEKIGQFLSKFHADLQLIRKPGRTSSLNHHRFYISWTAPYHAGGDSQSVDFHPTLELMHLEHPEDILSVDLSVPGHTPGAVAVDHSILLVCTHGKRDQCCALFGRPVAQQAHTLCGEDDHIWESSHTAGHRFAPSMILLPSLYSFGRLSAHQACDVVSSADEGMLYLEGNRGRGSYSPPQQAAELSLAQHLSAQGKRVKLSAIGVSQPDSSGNCEARYEGHIWDVEVSKAESGPIMASCGKGTKMGSSWTATHLSQRT